MEDSGDDSANSEAEVAVAISAKSRCNVPTQALPHHSCTAAA